VGSITSQFGQPMAYEQIVDLYDAYVTADFDVPFFLHEARQAGGPVLELMSGTGRVSIPLAEAGVALTCVDASAAMLAALDGKLAARGLHAAVHCMDVRKLSLPARYALIIIPFHSFSELLVRSDQQVTLSLVRDHLAAEGRFICTLQNPVVKLRTIDGQLRLWGKYRLDPVGTLLLWGLQQQGAAPEMVEGLQLYEEYDESGILRAKRMLELRYRLHNYREFRHLAEAAGFAVERVYGDYQLQDFDEASSPFMIWVLRSQR
jgi:SAM-dependent methyltransferase